MSAASSTFTDRAHHAHGPHGLPRTAGAARVNRADAEAASPEATDRRRARWRQVSFDEIWREQMPFGFVADQARRQAFADAMEATVRSFSGGARATGVEVDMEEI